MSGFETSKSGIILSPPLHCIHPPSASYWDICCLILCGHRQSRRLWPGQHESGSHSEPFEVSAPAPGPPITHSAEISSAVNYSAISENEIVPFAATWMDLEGIIQSEVSQKETTAIGYPLHVESKIQHKWSYLQIRNRLTDIETNLWWPKGKEWGERLADRNY